MVVDSLSSTRDMGESHAATASWLLWENKRTEGESKIVTTNNKKCTKKV